MNIVIDTILNYVEPDEEITLKSKLKADCGLSSFDMICLIQELSNELKVEAKNEDLKTCVTVGDLCKLFNVKEEATV